MERSYDVIVIGAGMAGLGAARMLTEAGLSVVVLEGRDRVGGRIFTIHRDRKAVELGAEFIHGRPSELLHLVEEAGLSTVEVAGTDYCFNQGQLQPCEGAGDDASAVLDRLENWTDPDISFAEYLDRQRISTEQRRSLTGYVEGFNAADHGLIGVQSLGRQQAAEKAIEGDRAFRIRGGYCQIPEFLTQRVRDQGGEIVFNTIVQRIEWRRGEAAIHCSAEGGAHSYRAPHAVITLPLGVLRAGSVSFAPEPQALREATLLRMGNVRRFTLLFREKFWGGLHPRSFGDLSFLFSGSSMPPVWWASYPEESNSLTGWVGGPRFQALATLTEDELAQKACAELSRIFSVKQAYLQTLLLGCSSHKWHEDLFAMGAYSYVPAGSIDASAKMSEPADNTLFFAGEHTDTTGHWGTVHAALRSGYRAASQVLAAGGKVSE